MEKVILHNSYRNRGAYPFYTLGASLGIVDGDVKQLYTVTRQYDEAFLVVNVYDSLDTAFGYYKIVVDDDTLTLPDPL